MISSFSACRVDESVVWSAELPDPPNRLHPDKVKQLTSERTMMTNFFKIFPPLYDTALTTNGVNPLVNQVGWVSVVAFTVTNKLV